MSKILIMLLIIISIQLVFGDEFIRLDQFSRELMQQGDYLNSIIECKRILSYYPTDQNVFSKTFQIARCYELMGNLQQAITYYKEVLKLAPDHWLTIHKLILIYHRDNNFTRSNEYISEFLPILAPVQRDSLRFISAFNFVHLDKYRNARANFEAIENPSLHKEGVKYVDILNYETPLPYKTKNQAIFLGTLMPGGGFLYVEKFNYALLSLVTTMLFGYTAFECHNDDNTGGALLTGGISLGIYITAIKESVKLVHKHNDRLKKNFNEKFRL